MIQGDPITTKAQDDTGEIHGLLQQCHHSRPARRVPDHHAIPAFSIPAGCMDLGPIGPYELHGLMPAQMNSPW